MDWLTDEMVQLTTPAAFVVPVQLCDEPPEPMVNVTVWPDRSVPGVGSLVVSTPVSVTGWPLVSVVGPV